MLWGRGAWVVDPCGRATGQVGRDVMRRDVEKRDWFEDVRQKNRKV